LGVKEELQKIDTSVFAKNKKNKKKVTHEVVIKR
jgi:hypothetical protein